MSRISTKWSAIVTAHSLCRSAIELGRPILGCLLQRCEWKHRGAPNMCFLCIGYENDARKSFRSIIGDLQTDCDLKWCFWWRKLKTFDTTLTLTRKPPKLMIFFLFFVLSKIQKFTLWCVCNLPTSVTKPYNMLQHQQLLEPKHLVIIRAFACGYADH